MNKSAKSGIFLLFSFLLFTAITHLAAAQIGITKEYKHAAVTASQQPAVEAGIQMLKMGGNAVDAAVAVNFALAVTYPQAGNIGGGGFMIIHMQGDTTLALDFRETAPDAAHADMYLDEDGDYLEKLSREGALASGVPGTVDGMVRAQKRFGNLPLSTVMQPAIEWARKGFRLTYEDARALNRHRDDLLNYEASRRYFTKAKQADSLYEEGELFVQEDLAATLSRIARQGRAGFYEGKTAADLVKTMEKHGGLIDREDLKEYRSIWRQPVSTTFRNYTLHMMGPPSSGGITISQMLRMLEGYDVVEMSPHSPRYLHLLAETMRRAFADRNYFQGDPAFVDIPRDTLLSRTYNRRRMKSFRWNQSTASSEISHGSIPGFEESLETTHFSVIDSSGNAVSVTTTLNGWFGSHLAVGGSGFLLNNEMDDFTAKPGVPNQFGLVQGKANAIRPGKRMLSSMTPTVVTSQDTVRMVLGAAGGPRIINTILQNFLNMGIHGMDAQQAVAMPRIHHQYLPNSIYYESFSLGESVKNQLREMGHSLKAIRHIGRAHILRYENGEIEAGVDPRGSGNAGGF